ncbi:Z-ring formation inhibitor MciZ [Paenibacillus sp. M1]|uniref:Z-ring formation inhibitor MciZ n=1 Tax=Paenibacillus haidiansis TaxID=1574488 RepID=A0ABU7VMB2_9BACL
MKSYFSHDRLRAQGKAWQVRILLSQWKKEAGAETKLKDFIQSHRGK